MRPAPLSRSLTLVFVVAAAGCTDGGQPLGTEGVAVELSGLGDARVVSGFLDLARGASCWPQPLVDDAASTLPVERCVPSGTVWVSSAARLPPAGCGDALPTDDVVLVYDRIAQEALRAGGLALVPTVSAGARARVVRVGPARGQVRVRLGEDDALLCDPEGSQPLTTVHPIEERVEAARFPPLVLEQSAPNAEGLSTIRHRLPSGASVPLVAAHDLVKCGPALTVEAGPRCAPTYAEALRGQDDLSPRDLPPLEVRGDGRVIGLAAPGDAVGVQLFDQDRGHFCVPAPMGDALRCAPAESAFGVPEMSLGGTASLLYPDAACAQAPRDVVAVFARPFRAPVDAVYLQGEYRAATPLEAAYRLEGATCAPVSVPPGLRLMAVGDVMAPEAFPVLDVTYLVEE